MKRQIIEFILVVTITALMTILFAWVLLNTDTTDCEKYEAARIPQDMNPCWGGIRK